MTAPEPSAARHGASGISTAGTALRDYVRILRRHKWLVGITIVLVAGSAVLYTASQPKEFEASAEVFLSRQNLANTLTGTSDPNLAAGEADRTTATQARLATSPAVAVRVIERVGLRTTVQDFEETSDVVPAPDTDVLVFTVRHGDPATAVRAATAFAEEYIEFRGELDTAPFVRAREELESRLADLPQDSALFESLVEKEQQLRTLENLQTSQAYVLSRPQRAGQVAPRPKRNAAVGLLLGVLLGCALAFLKESLDTRLRTADEMRSVLEMPLLARLPEPPRQWRQSGVMILEEPNSIHAEAYRLLRISLDLSVVSRSLEAILVTSAVKGEGKTTTSANLAATFAIGGRRVVLVDGDLRRPHVHRIFGIDQRPGVTDVAMGRIPLEEALHEFDLYAHRSEGAPGHGDATGGSLQILPAGTLSPNPGDFMASGVLADLLEALKERSDLVVLDAPPVLQLGDAFTLSAHVTGYLVVANLGIVRRPLLRELRRSLSAFPSPGLGFVATGAELDDEFNYDSYYDYKGDASKLSHERSPA